MADRRLHFEALSPYFGYYYTIRESLFRGHSEYQAVEVVETDAFGRALILDGATQLFSDKEFQYHEPLVHPALCAHAKPQEVLIIGAGDGGVLREVLKHDCVERADMVDLDGEVIELSRERLPEVSAGAFDDPRAHLHVADGRQFLREHAQAYDVILMDMTDPQGPSSLLYTREFFGEVRGALKADDGIFAMHAESPEDRPVAFTSIVQTNREVFEQVCPFFHFVHQYASNWAFLHSSPVVDVTAVEPALIEQRLAERGVDDLKLYTGEMHRAMSVRRPYIEDILSTTEAPIITDASPEFPDVIPHDFHEDVAAQNRALL